MDEMSRQSRLGFPLAVVVTLAMAASIEMACDRRPQVAFSLLVPQEIRDRATWYEIGAFPGATCPPLGQLAGGIPASGSAARVAFHRESATRPALGNIARGSYAFAAVAKGDDCSVLAAGCSVVDVGKTDEVSIALRAREAPAGACGGGNVCQNGQCVPPNDNAGDTVGAGCSLEVIGGGPLDNPLSTTGYVSHPGIVATKDGFLIAYRESDPVLGEAQVTFMAIDNGGAIAHISQRTLRDTCAGVEESDALGLSVSDGSAMAIVARQRCNDRAGFHGFYILDPFLLDSQDPEGIKYGIQVGPSLAENPPTLSGAHALAPAPGGEFFGAFLSGGRALISPTAQQRLPDTSPNEFGRPGGNSAAWVTATNRIVAMLALGTGVPDVSIPDAGADGGPASVDAGPPVGQLRLNFVEIGANLAALGQPIVIPAQSSSGSTTNAPWGSLAAQGTRLIVANSAPGGAPEFRVFDLGTSTPVAGPRFITGPGNQLPGRSVSFTDVAFHKDYAFFALEHGPILSETGGIVVVAYKGLAKTSGDLDPVPVRQVSLGSSTRIPRAVRDVRDGRVAIAASDTRVAVVWATARQLTPNDPTGGYALLACR